MEIKETKTRNAKYGTTVSGRVDLDVATDLLRYAEKMGMTASQATAMMVKIGLSKINEPKPEPEPQPEITENQVVDFIFKILENKITRKVFESGDPNDQSFNYKQLEKDLKFALPFLRLYLRSFFTKNPNT